MALKIKDSLSKIEKKIRNSLSVNLNNLFNSKKDLITKRLREECRGWMLEQPELKSLSGSSIPYSLHSLFGLELGSEEGVVNSIVEAVANSIEVKFTKIDNKLGGGITFYFQPEGFQNLLNLPEGHVITRKGVDIHWLDWLLTQGDAVVVAGYRYTPDQYGRSGIGRMRSGGSFRVPPSYSGVEGDNFITRALENREREITKIITEVFK